jgi:transcriptional regulator with XRE-family HTH domain
MSTLFSKIFLDFFRKRSMEAKGWTLAELAQELGIPENTITQRLHVNGINPLFRGAIYPPDTLDRIRESRIGRPPGAKSALEIISKNNKVGRPPKKTATE